MFRSFALCICVLACCAAVAVAAEPMAEFHVSPGGDDARPGTSWRPFRTLERARDAVREVNSEMSGDIVVYLDAGDYLMDKPLEPVSYTHLTLPTN